MLPETAIFMPGKALPMPGKVSRLAQWHRGKFTKTTISKDRKCERQRENNDTFRNRRNEQINSELMRNKYRQRQWNEFRTFLTAVLNRTLTATM